MRVLPVVVSAGRVTGQVLAMSAVMATAVQAQSARTVQDGVFTEAQATRGQALYAKQCASCHGNMAEGLQGPPLVGDAFRAHLARATALRTRRQDPQHDARRRPGNAVARPSVRRAGAHPEARRIPRRSHRAWPRREAALAAIGWPPGPAAAPHTRRGCSRLSAARQHGAADARHLLSELEPDLHGADTRSRCTCSKAGRRGRRRADRRLLIRGLGSGHLRRMAIGGQRGDRVGRRVAPDADAGDPLRERAAGARHRCPCGSS